MRKCHKIHSFEAPCHAPMSRTQVIGFRSLGNRFSSLVIRLVSRAARSRSLAAPSLTHFLFPLPPLAPRRSTGRLPTAVGVGGYMLCANSSRCRWVHAVCRSTVRLPTAVDAPVHKRAVPVAVWDCPTTSSCMCADGVLSVMA